MAVRPPKRKMRLNNKKLAYYRKQQFYDAVFADLVVMGALDKTTVENYFNAIIPSNLAPPYPPIPPTPPVPVSDLDLTAKFGAATTGTAIMRTFDATEYTGSIEWHVGSAGGTIDTGVNFLTGTIYVAIVTMTAKTGFDLTGIKGNTFTYTGATVTGPNDGIAIVTFPVTA
jgi:hypothetical protein